MAEYIEREALSKWCRETMKIQNNASGMAYVRMFWNLVMDSPSADVAPVVHGRWEWNEEDECWVCSNCKASALNNYRRNSTDSNYCPNCGARMQGGPDE